MNSSNRKRYVPVGQFEQKTSDCPLYLAWRIVDEARDIFAPPSRKRSQTNSPAAPRPCLPINPSGHVKLRHVPGHANNLSAGVSVNSF
jgi:hypothetical protein